MMSTLELQINRVSATCGDARGRSQSHYIYIHVLSHPHTVVCFRLKAFNKDLSCVSMESLLSSDHGKWISVTNISLESQRVKKYVVDTNPES